jgi:hypothetical protein
VVYPALFLTIAYALSVGNAGTGYRYRTHLVVLGLATLVILREHAKRAEEEEAAAADEDARRPRSGAVAPDPEPLAASALTF